MDTLLRTDVTVVIRSVGERTHGACRELLAAQVRTENIVTVSNAPFSATLADSYRAGIRRDLKWTLCIDADVLIAPGAVAQLLTAAEKMDASVCEVQGLVLDKLFGIRRPAGNHLYRTALLPRALELIPPEGRDIRPETHTLCRMAEGGNPWVETPVVIGLHDFEQYHRDVFRKCFIHARKFDSLMPSLVEYWRRSAATDPDYRVALAGLAAGIADVGEARVDIRRDNGFAEWSRREHVSEKPILSAHEPSPAGIERVLSTWPSPGEVLERYAACSAREIVHGPASAGHAEPPPRRPRPTGFFRLFPLAVGRALGKAGRKLERIAC